MFEHTGRDLVPMGILSRSQERVTHHLFPINSLMVLTWPVNAGDETQDNVQLLQQRVRDLKKSLERVEHQKNMHLKKMDVLITGDPSEEEIRLFKNEFKSLLQKATDEKTQLERQIASAERELKTLSQTSFSWSDISNHAQRVQEVMLEKDPVALKRAYYSLFKEIVFGPEDNLGNRTLTYIIKNSDETYEDVVRLRRQMVEAGGVEPPSASVPSQGGLHA